MEKAVIVAYARTPVARANKGSLVTMRSDDLGALVVKEAVKRSGVDPKEVEDVKIGCAFPEGDQGMNVGRMIGILAGLSLESGGSTTNRFCGSSLDTINQAAAEIMIGNADVVVAGGVESMTRVPMGGFNPSFNAKFMSGEFPAAYIPMGLTAENVAQRFEVSRDDQDKFALASHQKACKAIEAGQFKKEIIPVEVPQPDGKVKVFDTDECPRKDTTLEKLAGLKPVFRADGSVTAGNSSPLNDGAAAVVLMSEKKAKQLGIKPLVRIVAMAYAGVEPEVMGIGPIPAVRKVLERAGMQIGDIDIIELNEAFAAQSIAVVRELKIDQARLNPHGGGIAIGHPLGATGARIMNTLLGDLLGLNKNVGLETMCIGGGQGIATIVERV